MTKIDMTRTGPGAGEPPRPSGITVIVVGLGIAGLTAAIECHRRGHAVIGLEKKPDTNQFGDTVGISGNGASILKRWKNRPILDILGDDSVCRVSRLDLHDRNGNLYDSLPCSPHDPIQGNIIRRSGLLDMLYQEAFSLGIDLRFGVRIDKYWETDSSAGVLVGEEKITGDCVIAADGVHSKARKVVTGEEISFVEGMVAYRSIFRSEDIDGLPGTEWLLRGGNGQDMFNGYVGGNAFVNISTVGRGKYVTWACIANGHLSRDSEQWMQPASVDPVLEFIADWPAREKIAPILLSTPPGHCFNHALLTSEPLRRLVSSHGRMVLIGDAAHPALPTLGQGANQGIEDAAVVAICLELSGKSDVPLALRTAEKLRFPRVSAIQELSLKSINRLDDDSITFDGKSHDMDPWIYEHDCIRHTYEEFPKAAASVAQGTPYTPTNGPDPCSDSSKPGAKGGITPASGLTANTK